MKPQLETLIPVITKSQKFHLGDQGDTFKYFPNLKGKRLFCFFAEFLKLPYSVCWFDYFNNRENIDPEQVAVPKRGILAIQVGHEHIGAQIFNYFIAGNYFNRPHWFPAPYAYIIKVQNVEIPNIRPVPLNLEFAQSMKERPELEEKLIQEDQGDLSTLNNALLLLNCKNVGLDVVTAPQKLNKKRSQAGKSPLFTYHTLHLKLPGRIVKGKESASELTGRTIRIHWCRGHFKQFNQGHPLFGKHVGLWWWQASLRGHGPGGVSKEYKIEEGG